jgi:hypothetical protein
VRVNLPYNLVNGEGDFAIIPTIPTMNLNEFTISMRIKTPRKCKHRKILASLQHPDDYSVVLETDCFGRGDLGEIMEIRALLTDSRLGVTSYNLMNQTNSINDGKWHHSINDGKWHHVALSMSSSSGKMILYLDGKSIGDSIWPINADSQLSQQQQIKNVWLGTKPQNIQSRKFDFDYKGYMDDLVLSQSALSHVAIKAISTGLRKFL